MIYVRRCDCPPALDLSDPNSTASKEKAKAKAFYAKTRENEFKNFNFTAYKKANEALENLFHKKCAYCETKYKASSDTDIEHFRPKGGVVVDGDFYWPGYWWLAAEWTNLLPSCGHCNQKRRHRFAGEIKTQARGKENLFPLLDENDRAGWDEGEENDEVALLLDPCTDKRPGHYLSFWHERGGIHPRARRDGERRKRALASIKTYGLDRPELREARHAHQTRVLEATSAVGNALEALRNEPTNAQRRRKLADDVRDLRAFCNAKQEYAAMGRELARPVLGEVGLFLRQAFDQTETAFLASYPAQPLDRSPLEAYEAQLDRLRSLRR